MKLICVFLNYCMIDYPTLLSSQQENSDGARTNADWKLYAAELIRRLFGAIPVRTLAWLGAVICVFAGHLSVAQQPKGHFLSDSVKIGSPLVYSLSIRHSGKDEIIFPDKTYNFSPFELISKKYFPTHTDKNGSIDSVVYTLMSFEVDKVQRLSLPVYRITPKDCTALYTRPDSVIFHEMITGPPDTLSLKANTRYRAVKPEINYAYLILSILGLGVLTGLLYLAFGKRIRKQFRLYQMGRRHTDFLQAIEKFNAGKFEGSPTQMMEKIVVTWKKYIETLEDKPYSTYTTKEISDSIPDKPLAEALKDIDRTIYGGQSFDPNTRSVYTLQHFAVQLYIQRRKELQNS